MGVGVRGRGSGSLEALSAHPRVTLKLVLSLSPQRRYLNPFLLDSIYSPALAAV